ncbi:ATP-binding response regulator [Chryseobacterium sp. 22543]|uniref:ATP-binding response regulator n=1 Tax=Chryseobacterium sp. 22543 TaxID=3453940 RepID=UPI003F82AD5B
METGRYSRIKTLAAAPFIVGTQDIEKEEKKRQVIMLNAMAFILISLVVGVGSYFYMLKQSVVFLIGIPLESLAFLSVVWLNHRGQYFNANILMLCTNALFIAYWSTVLGNGISMELLFAFNTLIIFYLSSTFFLYKKTKALLTCIIATIGFASWMVLNSYCGYIKPISLPPDIAAIMRIITSVALLVFILCVMASYVAQIRSLLITSQRLKEASERKSAYLREVFHEIRTPMNTVFSIAQELQFRKDNYPAAEHREIDQLFSACHMARNFTNHVLEMSRIESGIPIALSNDTVSLRRCITKCVDIIGYLAASKGIEIKIKMDLSVDKIITDEIILTKIFNNLLSNAVKFSPNDSEVELNCTVFEGQLLFNIINEGIVDPEISGRMFDNFVTKRGKYEGSGLGLGITKHFVELFGGQIFLAPIDHENPQITSIVFHIPYKKAVTTEIATAPEVKIKKRCFSGVKALILEDDLMNYELLKRNLEAMGIETVHNEDGRLNGSYIKEEKPEVIIADLNMPELGGQELLALLKADPELASIPVLIISGDAFGEEEILRSGADAFLLKPIKITELYKQLVKYFPNQILS